MSRHHIVWLGCLGTLLLAAESRGQCRGGGQGGPGGRGQFSLQGFSNSPLQTALMANQAANLNQQAWQAAQQAWLQRQLQQAYLQGMLQAKAAQRAEQLAQRREAASQRRIETARLRRERETERSPNRTVLTSGLAAKETR